MKGKKLLAVALAAVLTLGMTSSVFAQTKTVKTGDPGSITIQSASYGETYELYKVFNATLSDDGNIAYTSDVAIAETAGLSFYTDSQMNVILKSGMTELTDADKAWIVANCSLVSSETANGDGTLVFDGLSYGYYYVKSSLGALIMVDSTKPAATMVEKNTTNPTVPDSGKTAADTTKTVGETETYTLTFTATNFAKKTVNNAEVQSQVTNYTIVDTSDDLKVDTRTVSATVTEPDSDAAHIAVDVTYAGNVLTISIPWVDAEGKNMYDNDTVVTITYDAEILTAGTIENTAVFNWNVTNQFGTDSVSLANFPFDLNKIDASNKALSGAEFTLAKTVSTSTGVLSEKISFVEDKGVYTVANSNDTTTDTTIVAGAVKIKGLGAGTYSLTEKKAPDGYNKLLNPITIVIAEDGSVTMDGTSVTTVDVVNQAGTLLPSTGGMGTTIFYIVGAVLVIGAGVVLVAKKRMAGR